MSVVVDTSVWVEYLRGSAAREVDVLLNDGLVLLAPLVAAELLSAPLSRTERRDLIALLESLPFHPTPAAHWFSVGELRSRLHRSGLSVSTPDAHVAQCALDAGALLWSHDAIFHRISKPAGLRLFGAG